MEEPECIHTLGERVQYTYHGKLLRVHIRAFYRGDKKQIQLEKRKLMFSLCLGLLLIPFMLVSNRWNSEWAVTISASIWLVWLILLISRLLIKRFGVETLTLNTNKMQYATALHIRNKRIVLSRQIIQGKLILKLKHNQKPMLFGPKLIPDSGKRVVLRKSPNSSTLVLDLDRYSGKQLIKLMKTAYSV